MDMTKQKTEQTNQSRLDLGGKGIILPRELTVSTHRINGWNRLEKFLTGVEEIRIIAYVMSLDFIETYLEDLGIKKMTVIIGKEVSTARRRSMDPEFVMKLARWQMEGRLNVRIPSKGEMHEKAFLCWSEDSENWFKDVNGSANPTMKGSGGKGQSNRITVVKIKGDYENDDYYLECMKQWDWYESKTVPFLSSLLELLPEPEEEWKNVVVRWLESDSDADLADTVEVRKIQQELGKGLHETSVQGNTIYQMSTDNYSSSSVDKVVEQLNKHGFGLEQVGNSIHAPISGLDLDAYTKSSMPMMTIIDDKVWIRVAGRNYCRTADDLDPAGVDEALNSLEQYVASVSKAHRGDRRAKMALAEYLLAVMAAPFDHLYMAERRRKFTRLREGPRMTSYYGTAGNGKTYACRYALKMLTGLDIEALTSGDFTQAAVLTAARKGSIFPLVFDDLQKDRVREWGTWGKFYWDDGFVDRSLYPQLIITANDRIDSGGPLGRRVREIAMHATFSASEENSVLVEELLQANTNIFLYFSKLMIEEWVQAEEKPYSHGDELSSSREKIEQLYKFSGRSKPDWWPRQPVEKIHDDNAYQWLDMINKNVCAIRVERDEIIAKFDDNCPSWEVGRYRKLLPSSMAAESTGTKVRIRNPTEFLDWIRAARDAYVSARLRWKTRLLLRKSFR